MAIFEDSIDINPDADIYQDIYQETHGARVKTISLNIAKHLGLDTKEQETIAICSIFHDIGKREIPDSILNKCGPLTNEERKIIETHPVHSYEYMLKSKYPKSYASIVRAHHEKLDGSGYPDKLSGNQILIYTRIITVADIYDALTSRRPYRSAYSSRDAIEIMRYEVTSNRIDKEVFEILQKII